MVQTDMYEGMLAETIMIPGMNGEFINAYFARPLGPGPFPSMVIIHHMPGWDEWYREATRKFAHHGYAALSPNFYYRVGHGTPEDVAVKVRAEGGVADDQVVGDIVGALGYLQSLPYVSDKIGVFGTCSGGRHASKWPSMSRNSKNIANYTISTCTPTPGTAFFTTTDPTTGRNKLSMAGKRFLPSWKNTLQELEYVYDDCAESRY